MTIWRPHFLAWLLALVVFFAIQARSAIEAVPRGAGTCRPGDPAPGGRPGGGGVPSVGVPVSNAPAAAAAEP
jgi:hypothetical protein